MAEHIADQHSYTVTIEIRSVYTIPVQASCVARAEKIANNLATESIRQNGTFIKSDHEVVEVSKEDK